MTVVHVPGKNAGSIMLYALSTCIWCKKAKELLDQLGVAYDYEYVDLLQGEQKQRAMDTVKKWNKACNFPTIIINGEKCIVGYQEEEIKKTLKL